MIKRRDFLKLAGLGTTGIGLSGSVSTRDEARAEEKESSPRIRITKKLGKTGLEISDIGFGAISLFNPNVLRYAYDCGVNHFDTAEGYMRKNSERILGEQLKPFRDKVVITTKHLINNPAEMERNALRRRMEESLQRLRSDYIDIAMVHSVDEPAKLANEEVQAAYTAMKKEGKARFIGFSTHRPKLLLPAAIESGIWEVVLLVYNHIEGPEIEPLMAEARKKGIGLIAMKVFAGGMQGNLKAMVNEKRNYAQAAIRWVLDNPSLDACIVTMSTFSHVEEYIAPSGMTPVRGDKSLLSMYRREANPFYCRISCNECLSACPKNVAVNNVLRYAMYFEHYGMEKHAMALYSELETERKPIDCASCSAPCQSACPHRLDVKARLLRAHTLLA